MAAALGATPAGRRAHGVLLREKRLRLARELEKAHGARRGSRGGRRELGGEARCEGEAGRASRAIREALSPTRRRATRFCGACSRRSNVPMRRCLGRTPRSIRWDTGRACSPKRSDTTRGTPPRRRPSCRRRASSKGEIIALAQSLAARANPEAEHEPGKPKTGRGKAELRAQARGARGRGARRVGGTTGKNNTVGAPIPFPTGDV